MAMAFGRDEGDEVSREVTGGPLEKGYRWSREGRSFCALRTEGDGVSCAEGRNIGSSTSTGGMRPERRVLEANEAQNMQQPTTREG